MKPLSLKYKNRVILPNCSTEYDEPQIFLSLSDDTSFEITHETNGLTPKKRYYSFRRNCSEEAFDNDLYHDTNGVMHCYVSTSLDDIQKEFDDEIELLAKQGIHIVDTDIADMPEIATVMTISSGLISEKSRAWLDLDPETLSVYKKDGYGWFIYCTNTNVEKDDIPDDIANCIAVAISAGCAILCLDGDGPETKSPFLSEKKENKVTTEKIEKFKSELFNRGQAAIEDFLGYMIDEGEDKDVTENRLDIAISDMSEKMLIANMKAFGIE